MPLDSIAVLSPLDRATDANGAPVPGAVLYFFEAGTTTPKTVFSDAELGLSLGTSVTCDSGGFPTSNGSTRVMIYTGTEAYKLVIKDADGATLWTLDDIPGAPEIPNVASAALPETPVVSKTATYTIGVGDRGKLINADPTGGSFALTLPDAVAAGDGWRIGVCHNGPSTANVVAVRSTGGQTIRAPGQSAATSIALTGLGMTYWFVCDGAGWSIDSSVPPKIGGPLPYFTVTDRLAAPPVSPVGGQRYIINSTPTGVWLTLGFAEDDIAESDGNGSWLKYTPGNGWLAWVEDEDLITSYHDGSWVDWPNVTAPTSSSLRLAVYSYTLAQNTGGGQIASAAWTTYPLNTEDSDTIGASISSNQITLPKGSYLLRMQAPFYFAAGTFRLRVRNTTTGAIIYGSNAYSPSFATTPTVATPSTAHLTAPITIAAATENIIIEYYSTSTGGVNSSLGIVLNVSGISERYGVCEILDLSSLQGPQGIQGIQGNDGLDAAYSYQRNTATSGDPGSGKVLFNHATLASATALHVSETDANGSSLASAIATWDNSTSVTFKARVRIHKEGAPQNWIECYITGAGTDQGSYWTFPISGGISAGTISNGDGIAVLIIPNGDLGDPGISIPDPAGLSVQTDFDDETDYVLTIDGLSTKKSLGKNLGFTQSSGARRSLQSKLREFVHVDDFAGSTFTDRLIAALASGEKSIHLPKSGTLTLEAGVSVATSGQRLVGPGRKPATILVTALAAGITVPTGLAGVEMFDFTINRTLPTVTISVASPGVVTLNSHGLVAGNQVAFDTTGTLPTGLTKGVNYFVIATGLTANSFRVSATLGGSAINTSGSPSGVHTMCASTWHGIQYVGLTERAFLARIDANDHWHAFRGGATSYSRMMELFGNNSFGNGIHITNEDAVAAGLQWYIDVPLMQQGNGWGVYFESVFGSGASVGELVNWRSYANARGGAAYVGTASHPINAVRQIGGFSGQEGGDSVYFDTYGSTECVASDVHTEANGVGLTGRNGNTFAASGQGRGFYATANNVAVVLDNPRAVGHSWSGIKSAAPRTAISNPAVRLCGAAAFSGELDGIDIVGDRATITGGYSKANRYGLRLRNDNNHVVVGIDLTENTTGSITTDTGIVNSFIALNPGSTFNHIPNISQNFALTGIVTPSQITSDQNDYALSAAASSLRLSSDASRNVTGIQGGAAGRLIIVHNVGSNPITLKKDNGSSSTAANRFAFYSDVVLLADESITLQYDTTSARWRAIGHAAPGYLESIVPVGSAVSLTTLTTANLTSLPIPAGKWDVFIQFQFTGGTTTDVFNVEGSLSSTSATHDLTAGRGTGLTPNAGNTFNNLASNHPLGLSIGPIRIDQTSATTWYATASSIFADSTCSVFGIMTARKAA